MTLKQIGQEIGLTRERVRQIELDALRKLQVQLTDDRPSRFFRQAIAELTDEECDAAGRSKKAS